MSKPLPYIIRNPNGRLYFRRRYPAKDRRANPNLPEAFQVSLGTSEIEEALPAWNEALATYKSICAQLRETVDPSSKKIDTATRRQKLIKLRVPKRSEIRLSVERWYTDYLAQYNFDNDLRDNREFGHIGGKIIGGLNESIWDDRLEKLNQTLPERSAEFAAEIWERNNWDTTDQDELIEYTVDLLTRAEKRAIKVIFERAASNDIEFESDRRRKETERKQRDFTIHDAIEDYKRRFPEKTDMLKKLEAAGSAWRSLMSYEELSKITRSDAIDFIDLMGQVPARYDLRFKGLPLNAAIDANNRRETPYPRLKAKTVKTNYIGPLSTAVTEAVTRKLVSTNPFYGIKVSGSTKQAPHRRSFYIDELRLIFSQPVFTGFRDKTRRNTPGDTLIKDHFYWPAIIALYTGLRASEIGALTPSSLQFVDPVQRLKPYLEIKGTKTDSAHRWVPIHPDLERLGFIRYIDEQQAMGSERLFPGWTAPKGKKLSDARCIRNFNLKVASVVGGSPNPSFHCLRHTLSTELINTHFNPIHRRFVLGHAVAKKDISDIYYTSMMDRIYDEFVVSVRYEQLDLPSQLA